ENKQEKFDSFKMNMLLADSVFIYRSPVSGGPYAKIASVDAAQSNFTDTSVVPLKDYYYVANVVTSTTQSDYSNEAFGQVNDSLFTFSIQTPQGTVPSVDGVLSPGEWDDAFKVDVSDVLGYSGSPAIPQGSAFMYFKFDDQNDMLYIAGEDFLNTTLDDNEGFGLYFDDNHNKTFEPNGALPIYQEGNFWAYWHPSGSDLRFRQIFTGGGVGTVETLTDGQAAFSDGSGHLTGEVAIPMGFMEGYQLQVYGPDNTVGLGGFLIQRDAVGAAIFHGWWPQTMNSVFDPHYFGDVNINVTLEAPPQIPGNISVTKQGGSLIVTWTDPTLGLNNYPLSGPPQIKVFRNGEFFANIGPGIQSLTDDNVGCGQWYEYSLQASVIAGNDTLTGPISQPVGTFACGDPALTEIKYDDGSWEAFYVVSFSYDNDKFALRFTPTYYPAKVMRLQTTVNSNAAFDFTLMQDSSGFPGGHRLAGPYRVSATGTGTVRTITFTLPGSDPPLLPNGDFWVLINYLPETPGNPGIGVDADPPNSGRGKFYQTSTGWQDFTAGNLMITAFTTDTTTITGNEQVIPTIPKSYELSQNYPNPFNPTTAIKYQLPESQNVTLEIYNSLGEKIRTLVNYYQNAGYHTAQWDGMNNAGHSVASGMYLYRITAGKFTSVKKMLLLK
ncbi:MAG TPA: FlgD immunoglobulin-like domain containing protein, partial [Ignavibacteriaceae bacterium]|nr:FlgD immunoglobulin-like domain containing protein [Ignavibacteriaceae bacterium]